MTRRGGQTPPNRGAQAGFGFPPLTRGGAIIIGFNLAIWTLTLILFYANQRLLGRALMTLTLTPEMVSGGHFYQLATYMFLHDLYSPFHVLMNMLLVYFFAAPLEQRWGARRTLWFAFLCGIGGGLMIMLFHLVGALFGAPGTPTIGFSGAALGMLAAFCLLEAEAQILLFFVIPIKARHILPLTVAIDFLFWVIPGSTMSFPAHLGGILTGALLVTGAWRPGRLVDRWRLHRIRRARDHQSSRDDDNVIRGPW